MKKLMILVAALALSACGQRDETYPPHYEFNFMQACEAQRPAAGVCDCIWARVIAEVPRRDFEALEHQSVAQRESNPLTQQIAGYGLQCAAAAPAPAEPEAPAPR